MGKYHTTRLLIDIQAITPKLKISASYPGSLVINSVQSSGSFIDMDLARAPRRTARKKGSGYENANFRNISICRNLDIKKPYIGI
jgi:hypothetical protein